MAKKERLELIQEIERVRKSKVITYITSDRENLSGIISYDAVKILYENLKKNSDSERKKIDLYVFSRGGDSDIPWTIVSTFRSIVRDGEFNVIIPYYAHSAATVIAIGADEIVMGEKGELGPIDITINRGPYNPTERNSNIRLPISVEDVTGYFALIKKIGCERPDEILSAFNLITKRVHPLALGHVNRLLEQTKLVALKLLKKRREPLSDENNEKIVRQLSSEIFSHRHAINRDEARDDVGIKFVKDAEEDKIDNFIWELFKEYENELSLGIPFRPEDYFLKHSDINTHTWSDEYIALIESTNGSKAYKQSVTMKRIKKVPPTININLGNIGLPPINLPAGVNPQQIEQVISQILNNLIPPLIEKEVNNVANKIMSVLPDAGFEQHTHDAGWRDI